MSARLRTIFVNDFSYLLRRPLFWSLVAIVTLLAWGMSTGTVSLGTGTAFVGGKKAWITSEFSNTLILAIVAASLFPFFAAIATGLSVLWEREIKLEEILRSTPLRPLELAVGKVGAHLAGFTLLLLVQVGMLIFFNHVWPNPSAADIRGPLALTSYLRPALIFALPTILFYSGTAFFVAARWRRSAPVFLLPLAVLFAEFTFLWNWSPSWLDPSANRLLMLVDVSGLRWLTETWTQVDRGSDFYNLQPVGLDGLIVVNRLLWASVGIGAALLASRSLTRERLPSAGRRHSRPRTEASRPAGLPEAALRPRRRVGLAGAALALFRGELGALVREPGFYIFAVFIWAQSFLNSLFRTGVFDTPVLWTSGLFAASTFNTLSLLLCLLLSFVLVESLAREATTGIEPLVLGAPPATASLLLAKLGAVLVLALGVMAVVFTSGALRMAAQGVVRLELFPFVLLWGVLLLPTLVAFGCFAAAVWSLSGSRLAAYGISLGVLAYTVYKQQVGEMNWVGNWLLWDGGRWSDLSILELDRQAIVLNRLMVVGVAVFFFTVAVAAWPRQRWDPTRLLVRLRPKALLGTALRFTPYAASPLAAGVALWLGVLSGYDGEAAQKDAKEYWKQNSRSWEDAPVPALERVELELDLYPEEGAFGVRGTYYLVNRHDQALERFGVTGARHWKDVQWSLANEAEPPAAVEPTDRSKFFVFAPTETVAPGARLRLGFEYRGRYPDGISENAGSQSQFILPGSVVLHSLTPTFLPVLGYLAEIGVDDDNQANPRDYDAGRHREILAPLFAASHPFSTRIQVSLPEDMQVNSIGRKEVEWSEGGRRTVVWASEHPVRIFNVVAGRWQVAQGDGVAIYHHPEHRYNVEEMLQVLAAARRHYSEWFAPFPWDELRISEFAGLATYAQGFPTNITFSETIGFLTRSEAEANAVMLVTAHESAHQWWGNLLTPGDGPGGNLLSEAMAHFSTALLIEELEGERGRIGFLRGLEDQYGERRFRDAERPLVQVDGTRRGDRAVTYDKGGWVFWMLLQQMGREEMLAGLQEFIRRYQSGPDYPILEDLAAVLREHARDPDSFDRFVADWLFDVVVPEYHLTVEASRPLGERWRTVVTVENVGSGRLPVEIAAVAGERWREGGYRVTRQEIVLGAGEARRVELLTAFEPERVLPDPDYKVLQLRRSAATAEL